MIFYFTGTGNSWEIARKIASNYNEKLVSISESILNNRFTYELKEDERIGFVFPCHAWSPPKIVLEFVKKLNLINYNNNYLYFISTCEIDTGYTDLVFKRILHKKNFVCNAGFSFVMPNNYILFWGYEVDDQEKINAKHLKGDLLYQTINTVIDERKNVSSFKRGNLPLLKTYLIRYIFYYIQFKPNKFYAQDTCVSCGICEKACPMHNIKLTNQKPIWGKKCVLCLSCIHICPHKTIQYGQITLKKGRYFNIKYKKFLYAKKES